MSVRIQSASITMRRVAGVVAESRLQCGHAPPQSADEVVRSAKVRQSWTMGAPWAGGATDHSTLPIPIDGRSRWAYSAQWRDPADIGRIMPYLFTS